MAKNLIKTCNNQLAIDDSSRRDVGEVVQGGWSMGGESSHPLGDN
jgi:hypothetical protein